MLIRACQSNTFSVTPMTLIASFTWGWFVPCASSSQIQTPRPQMATHLRKKKRCFGHHSQKHIEGKKKEAMPKDAISLLPLPGHSTGQRLQVHSDPHSTGLRESSAKQHRSARQQQQPSCASTHTQTPSRFLFYSLFYLAASLGSSVAFFNKIFMR